MKTKEFLEQTRAAAYAQEEAFAEFKKRLSLAQEIARNLMLKHFHNFDVRLTDALSFLYQPAHNYHMGKDGSWYYTLQGKPQRIPSVYLSGDVWAIAKALRKALYASAYAKAKAQNEENSQRVRQMKTEQQRLESKLAENERNIAETQRKMSRLYRLAR